jgi:hypothetical protein
MRGVFDIVFRIVSTLLGLLLVLMGLIWIGQGLHVGPAWIMHSFMVSHRRWALFGAILLLVGVGQMVWSNTRRN